MLTQAPTIIKDMVEMTTYVHNLYEERVNALMTRLQSSRPNTTQPVETESDDHSVSINEHKPADQSNIVDSNQENESQPATSTIDGESAPVNTSKDWYVSNLSVLCISTPKASVIELMLPFHHFKPYSYILERS